MKREGGEQCHTIMNNGLTLLFRSHTTGNDSPAIWETKGKINTS